MGKYLVYIEYFWLLSVQVQFGVIQCISNFRRPGTCCISEIANRRAKRHKFGRKYLVYMEYFWLFKCFRCISEFRTTLYLENQWSYSKMDQISASEVSLYIVPAVYGLSLLSVQGQFVVIRCISIFWRSCIYLWLKYSLIFELLSYILLVFF